MAPIPGFTASQYDRLALLYVVASARHGEWLIQPTTPSWIKTTGTGMMTRSTSTFIISARPCSGFTPRCVHHDHGHRLNCRGKGESLPASSPRLQQVLYHPELIKAPWMLLLL